MLQGLITDLPLMISGAIQHAATFHGATEIVAREVDGTIHRYTYAEAHQRTKRLAKALSRLDRETLLDFLPPGVARWWLPDDVLFLPEMPMTATGKIHKLTLREQFRDYKLPAAERAPASE